MSFILREAWGMNWGQKCLNSKSFFHILPDKYIKKLCSEQLEGPNFPFILDASLEMKEIENLKLIET